MAWLSLYQKEQGEEEMVGRLKKEQEENRSGGGDGRSA